MDLTLILTGMVIGLSVSAPLGPVNILVVRNAIERGFGVAFAVGLGAVVADAVYAVIAAYGIRSIAHLITAHAKLLMILGGVLLVAIGLRLARSEVSLAQLKLETAPGKRAIAGRVFTAFSLTITNPGVFFGFLAIFGSMNAVLQLDEAWHRPVTLVAGVIAGGLLWWLVLSLGVSRFRDRIGEKSFGRVNRWTGVLIAAFGFALLMEALF
jgi:threonine/homoserine/homoserine lactone efflux protein